MHSAAELPEFLEGAIPFNGSERYAIISAAKSAIESWTQYGIGIVATTGERNGALCGVDNNIRAAYVL